MTRNIGNRPASPGDQQPYGMYPPAKPSFSERANRFWLRVTEGMQLSQLWNQFRTDAQSSYRLYSKEVDVTRGAGVRPGQHFWHVAGQFFWAIVEKLTPARRVLLL